MAWPRSQSGLLIHIPSRSMKAAACPSRNTVLRGAKSPWQTIALALSCVVERPQQPDDGDECICSRQPGLVFLRYPTVDPGHPHGAVGLRRVDLRCTLESVKAEVTQELRCRLGVAVPGRQTRSPWRQNSVKCPTVASDHAPSTYKCSGLQIGAIVLSKSQPPMRVVQALQVSKAASRSVVTAARSIAPGP